ncbi:hypothetical protein HAX54_023734 [Datura stramonium]|uniref:Uncharacterized protein n=1 Tax=Datura stramonium TaxID=4076 RepID=A0ABS8UXY5_DATST|nr:hypothetical protein [Datura stramonium]
MKDEFHRFQFKTMRKCKGEKNKQRLFHTPSKTGEAGEQFAERRKSGISGDGTEEGDGEALEERPAGEGVGISGTTKRKGGREVRWGREVYR